MGRTNVVYTGLAIKYGDKIHKFTESTEVTFGKFDDAHIRAYVETGEPMYVRIINANYLQILILICFICEIGTKRVHMAFSTSAVLSSRKSMEIFIRSWVCHSIVLE